MNKHSTTLRQAASLSDDLERLDDLIRRRAYEIFLNRGGDGGSPLDDWLLAEQEVGSAPTRTERADGRG